LGLIAFVKRPLLDFLAADETGLREDFQMHAGGGVADFEFSSDQQAANAVGYEVAIALRGEVAGGPLEPVQDEEAIFVREGAEELVRGRHGNPAKMALVCLAKRLNDDIILPWQPLLIR
jgi:hypothetical protein